MRVKLRNQKEFFDEILSRQKCNLKQLSKIISVNYSVFKKYRRGELSIPEKLFNKLLKLSPNKNLWLEGVTKLEDRWGVSKAGKISALKDKNGKRIAYARRFIKIPKLEIKINEFFCEFYGALLGDGCISRFKDCEGKKRIIIFISGNKNLDSEYLKHLQKELKKNFNINSYFYQYKSQNKCNLIIRHKNFSLYLNKIGFPIGKKYGKLKIPNKIIKLPWKFKKMVIRGFFDTDGNICAKKREKYKYPQVCLTSIDRKLLNQIYNILRKRGYPCWTGGNNVFVRGNEVTKRWFNDIGSSNNRNIFKYQYWLKNKVLPPKLGPLSNG